MTGFRYKHGILLAPMAISMMAYAADYLNESQAQKVLFPEADEFLKQSITLSDKQLGEIKELAGLRQRNKSPLVWTAKKKGKVLGLFFIDEVVGKHEFITYAVAVSPEGIVQGVEIMSYLETHGGEVREASWRKNLKGKKITDPFKLDVDVPNITGATLSCRNVMDGVKRLLALQKVLGNG